MAYEQFSQVYDRLMEDMPYEDWLRFASSAWERHGKPRTVVDLGCGTGRLAIELAQLGYEVVGIDLSEDMLAIARNKADEAEKRAGAQTGGSLLLLQQDMREWSIGRQVESVVSFCDCMNYLLEPEDLAATFQHTYDALQSGGLFLFDMHSTYQLRSYFETQPFMLNEEDVAYIWTCDFDYGRCEIEHDLTIFVKEERAVMSADDGVKDRFVRVDERHMQRAYAQELVTELLERAGFVGVEIYADFKWEAPDEESQRLFFWAVKP
ncbi:class I SAM-dependent methyltransferase [Paenibacillus sp. YYML68]|uniref:class I SAM-dependent DNA methyltransferase n=1 Tax=Paenibacillus sp. YYML68 TaxID=2909250 RepID=UPI0024937566|nr:class I SAM-dependent methyltransferase [Paenibacillus sp. YYML68]